MNCLNGGAFSPKDGKAGHGINKFEFNCCQNQQAMAYDQKYEVRTVSNNNVAAN